MKIIGKLFSIILISVGSIAAAGGAVTFGVCGAPTYKTTEFDNDGIPTEGESAKIENIGAGWLNFSSNQNIAINSLFHPKTFTEFLNYTQNKENVETLKSHKSTVESELANAKKIANDSSVPESQRKIARTNIIRFEVVLSQLDLFLITPIMYYAAISGVIIMSVGALAAIAGIGMIMSNKNTSKAKA